MQTKKIKVIISGGGSGGHVFPAIAIANALKNKVKDVDILFVGARGKMEMQKVPAAGYKIEGLWISGFQRKVTLKNLMFPIKLICSFIKAKRIIHMFKPDIVIGVGGYASGPIVKAAINLHIPTLIQEQNSFPGITNKMLAGKVNKICVAYENMDRFFSKDKIFLTGNPIRQDIINIMNKKDIGLKHFGLSDSKKVVLVIGGSLGARTINESIHKSLVLFEENNLQLLWQTGKNYFSTAKDTVKNENKTGVKVLEFINEMDYAYSVADLIVSRAGAIAISELCVVAKPVILIPSPNVAEDHQTKNAMALVNKKAAILINDNVARNELGKTIIDLINNKELQEELGKNIGALAIRDSAEKIANEILDLNISNINKQT